MMCFSVACRRGQFARWQGMQIAIEAPLKLLFWIASILCWFHFRMRACWLCWFNLVSWKYIQCGNIRISLPMLLTGKSVTIHAKWLSVDIMDSCISSVDSHSQYHLPILVEHKAVVVTHLCFISLLWKIWQLVARPLTIKVCDGSVPFNPDNY